MIQFADNTMVIELKNIWKECFHDEDSYIDFFFREYFSDESTLVYLIDGKPVSMLTLMPARLHEKEDLQKVYYIYAVATLPEARGKGYSSMLLDYANEITSNATFLQPATKKLERFYERNGYSPTIIRKMIHIEKEQLEKDEKSEAELKAATLSSKRPRFAIKELSDRDCGLYKKIRDRWLSGNYYVEWEAPVLAYAIKENAFKGGKTLLVDDTYVVMIREYEDVLYIREHTMPSEMIVELARQLLTDSKAKECSIHLTQTDNLQAVELQRIKTTQTTQTIMSRFPVERGKGYFSLAFE